MATSMMINNKRVAMSVEQKARLLTVIDIHEAGAFAVTSGSNPDDAYVVRHNGRHSIYCPCNTYGARCSHRIALDWKLEADRRAVLVADCDPHGLYL